MTNRDGPMFFPPRNWSRRFGTQFFTIEIASVEISEDNKTAEKSAYYHIIVKRGKQERIVARRYSEFYEFHRLLVRFSSYARRCNFPPKTWFRNVSKNFLEERRELLDKYLQQVLHDQRIARHKYTIAFLNLNNFELYKWWDFLEKGYSEMETDIDPTLRERHLNSKSNRKSKQKQPDEEKFTFNRSNSLYNSSQNQASNQPSTTTATDSPEITSDREVTTTEEIVQGRKDSRSRPTIDPLPLALPDQADKTSVQVQTGV